MIYRKMKELLRNEFHISPEDFDEATLVEDLGIDLVDLALALEECFDIEEVPDLSNLETLDDLIEYLQSRLY